MRVKLAYVDTSALTALALGEAGAGSLGDLGEYDALVSSNLLEAELRSVFAREGVTDVQPDFSAASRDAAMPRSSFTVRSSNPPTTKNGTTVATPAR